MDIKNIQSKKILVTGSSGFIGRSLVDAFREQHKIYGLDNVLQENSGVDKSFIWKELDNVSQIDMVIHLAGKAHDIKNASAEEEYFEINVGLTKKIFLYFLESNATKFIFFSSVKAVSDSITNHILTEDVLPDPKTAYGKSKYVAEKFILNEFKKWEEEMPNGLLRKEKKIFILRPCMIHGPGNKGNLNLLFNTVNRGVPWPLGSFENKRSFLGIDNLCFIIQELIEREDILPGIYNLSDDESLSTNEVVKLIAASQNKKYLTLNLPQSLIINLAKFGDILKFGLNSERLQKLTESYIVSNTKIKTAIGKPLPFKAKVGLMRTFQSFKHND